MYYFTPDTIAQANRNIETLDGKAGGLICVLSCLMENIDENISYTIDGKKLRKQLSMVFDKEPKDTFDNVKSNYIIFAKGWATTFFNNYIKNRVDLLSCAVFFLRRYGFEREFTKEEVIDTFIKCFNLKNFKDSWFFEGNDLILAYNQSDVEDNQAEFYIKMNYINDFKSILFHGVIQKSAADLKAAGQIQTLYSGSGVQTCFLLSDEPLDQYYIMSNSNQICSNQFSAKAEPGNTGNTRALFGTNKIFYGAPGCGKSRHVCDLLVEVPVAIDNIIRVTFHPEYANCDFIGQILPTVETKKDEITGEGKEIVKYIFNPGPFTLALQTAYNTNDMVFLIIEEINRGNAAAIFGDMFQLLDRVKDNSKPNYCCSEYPVRNPNMQKYLIGSISDEVIKEELKNGIFIPSNLTIYATMNTSDQNVFTLDTAFKRRWSFEQISNDITKDTDHAYRGWYVPGTEVTWADFLTKLNDKILDYKLQSQTNEDKRLGKYFVTKDCLVDPSNIPGDISEIAHNFAYKVLEYVWNDVCKIGREEWFDTEHNKTLEDLIEAFINPKEGETPLSVFQNIIF